MITAVSTTRLLAQGRRPKRTRSGTLPSSRARMWMLLRVRWAPGAQLTILDVRKVMTGADEEEKARLVKALHKQKEANAKDLQKTVTVEYAEFVTISKEISTLENEMLELKELLTEWKTVPQLMGKEDTLAPTLDKDGNGELFEQEHRLTPSRTPPRATKLAARPSADVQGADHKPVVDRRGIAAISPPATRPAPHV